MKTLLSFALIASLVSSSVVWARPQDNKPSPAPSPSPSAQPEVIELDVEQSTELDKDLAKALSRMSPAEKTNVEQQMEQAKETLKEMTPEQREQVKGVALIPQGQAKAVFVSWKSFIARELWEGTKNAAGAVAGGVWDFGYGLYSIVIELGCFSYDMFMGTTSLVWGQVGQWKPTSNLTKNTTQSRTRSLVGASWHATKYVGSIASNIINSLVVEPVTLAYETYWLGHDGTLFIRRGTSLFIGIIIPAAKASKAGNAGSAASKASKVANVESKAAATAADAPAAAQAPKAAAAPPPPPAPVLSDVELASKIDQARHAAQELPVKASLVEGLQARVQAAITKLKEAVQREGVDVTNAQSALRSAQAEVQALEQKLAGGTELKPILEQKLAAARAKVGQLSEELTTQQAELAAAQARVAQTEQRAANAAGRAERLEVLSQQLSDVVPTAQPPVAHAPAIQTAPKVIPTPPPFGPLGEELAKPASAPNRGWWERLTGGGSK